MAANQAFTTFALLRPDKKFPQWTIFDRAKRHTIATFPPEWELNAQLAFDALKLGVPTSVIRAIVDRHGNPALCEEALLGAIQTFRAAQATAPLSPLERARSAS